MISCGNPRAQYLAHRAEIDDAIHRVLAEGQYVLGKEVRAFEAEFAAYIGVRFAIGVASGTDALAIALRACDIGPGDEVVTVSHTAVATVAAIELTGATAVLVDIDPESYAMEPAALARAMGSRTRAIVPVHLYGQPADLAPIADMARQHGVRLIEDCAQAHGARYQGRRVGSWGDVACFSFYPTKNLGAIGDGGAVVTADAALAERIRSLREYGWTDRYVSGSAGGNSRLDEVQAAILRVKLPHLDADNAARGQLAHLYTEALSGLALVCPQPRAGTDHVYHLYVVRSGDRDNLQKALHARAVAAAIHYPVPVHLQPAYRGRLRGADRLRETERAAREVLSLPIYPELSRREAQDVIDAVRASVGADVA